MLFTKKRRLHLFRIEYTIMVNGENYPRSVEMPGRDEEHAKENWKKYRDRFPSDCDYSITSTTKIR